MQQEDKKSLPVCIAANFTIEPVERYLWFWMRKLGITAEVRFAPYNQVFQQLLEGGLLRGNRDGINLVALDLNSWLADGEIAAAKDQLAKTIEEFVGVLRSGTSEGMLGLVLVFPDWRDDSAAEERNEAIAVSTARLLRECSTIPGWRAIELAEIASMYAVVQTHDRFTDKLGHIPFTEDLYATAATVAARWIRCVRTKARKVLVLDCDNTLWQGVCGEGAVQFSDPYRKLQEFVLQQRDGGVLLAMASKNNEDDVLTVLETESCALKSEHFTAWQINWQPKSENLKVLSEELGLALNSFMFLDDSPLECMEVRNSCPEVLTIELPELVEAIPAFLQHYWGFDRPAPTEEDRNRASMYQAERKRSDLSRRALTREEFLASLKIQIQVAKVSETELQRVAQLTHRTTQFNMTGVQHSVQSLTEKLSQPRNECWIVRVRDIFGDYGLVGVLLFEAIEDSLRVDTFLLSCRALGRGVEDRMVEDLKRWAIERGVERVAIPFSPTARNKPALEFLSRLCDVPAEPTGSFECVLAADGSTTEWRPSAKVEPVVEPETVSAKLASDEGELLAVIAKELQSAHAIIAAANASDKKLRARHNEEFAAPGTLLEESLARIWSDILRVEPIGATDNFFELGGQSLSAVLMLAKVRSATDIELDLTEVFEHPSLRELAERIERRRSQPQEAAGSHLRVG